MKTGVVRRLAVGRSARGRLSLGAPVQHMPSVAPKNGGALACFASVEAAVEGMRPAIPMYCLHPQELDAAAATFLEHFPGHVFYAVKSNPDPYIITRLYARGVRRFDVASLGEIKLVRSLVPDATLAFMHTVKAREAIRSAYFDYGVRVFVLDCLDELHKIRTETDHAQDLFLFVRLDMPKGTAAHPLSGKFGASPDDTVMLLQEAAKTAAKVGLSFHVGQQTLDPISYEIAMRSAGAVVEQSGVTLAALDVGGGFPAACLGDDVLPPLAYFAAIRRGLEILSLPEGCEVWCEPGRALCATSTTLVLRVELRKGNKLYVNDGSYGALFDLCWVRPHNDVYMVRPGQKADVCPMAAFELYGPTCDSIDHMRGPFMLPDDIGEGDWIAFRNMGSYGFTMQTGFNGFYSDLKVEVAGAKKSTKLQVKGSSRGKVGA